MVRWFSRLLWQLRSPAWPLIPLEDPRLRQPALPVPAGDMARAGSTIRFLEETLHWFRARRGSAHGIAAPQLGIPERIVVVERDRKEYPMVNPVIIRESGDSRPAWERCMSFPHLAVCVERPVSLSVRFAGREGSLQLWEDVDQGLASVIRHEVDHLDGILTLDRAAGPGMVVPWEILEGRHRDGH